MKTLNRPKRSKPPLPVSTVKTVAPTTPPQPPTSESVSLARHARVIQRGTQKRIEQQRLERSKVSTKTVTPGISPRLPVISSTRKVPTVAPTAAAEPKLSPAAIRSLEFATKCMERTDRTLNQRRLMAFHHLRQDPALLNLNPDDLISEQAKTDSCSTQKAARPIE